ncbi:MAG TPA: glucose-6-phosphate isomerase [Sphingomicrobium sp.]|nr:glucose-6-phosphate isomerase [Sphingomicrobium sp.]
MAGDPWQPIIEHPERRLDALFRDQPDRLSALTLDVAGLYFDWSKTHLDRDLMAHFVALAEARDVAGRRDALFAGEVVNPSEGRPATHVAERGNGAPADVELAKARRARVRALVDAVEAGAFGDVTGILHIGIGGSLLGPALLVDALGRGRGRYWVRFVANVDPQVLADATAALDPATTLVIAASKSFTTAETMTNLDGALDWLRQDGVADPYGRVIAVTAAPDAAVDRGIDETRVLPIGEGVGGRYSLWSAVGVTAALALGWDSFEELLEGGAEMDRHFRYAEPAANAPLLAAFADQLYVQRFGAQSRAVFPYVDRLRLLVPYIQQLEMESLGKSVTCDGSPTGRQTGAVTWGGVGTDVQHAVFQLLHQGSLSVPVEFVLVRGSDDMLLLNGIAQGAALMQGRQSDDPQRHYPGDRPSAAIMLDQLDARTLGALLAFYEHRTFANAVLLGINPFDQFGVELGKEIAGNLGESGDSAHLDPSTRALVERAGS